MEYGAGIKVATIILWNFFALLVNVIAFVTIYMKANRNASLKAFFVVQSAMMIWLLGKVLKTVSPTVELRWFFIVFYYFGICLLAVSFLDFSYICCKNRPLKYPIRILIYGIGVLQFIIVATNPYHHLFYSVYGFWGDDFGVLFYVQLVINYLFFLSGMGFASKRFHNQFNQKSKLKKHMISLAILLPLVFNFIYITRTLESLFKILGIQVFDITPIVYTWSILVFVYATFKYEFFDLTPIMKHEITQNLNTPVLILNDQSDVLFTNQQFEEVFSDREMIVNHVKLVNHEKRTIAYKHQFYQYHVSKYGSVSGSKYIIGFTDITAYELAKLELDRENKELDIANTKLEQQIKMLKQSSRVGARNDIARELHDILGHSLVVTIKLLEVSKMFAESNHERAYESLEKADHSIKHGFAEMKKMKRKNSSQIYHTATLERELKSMLKIVIVSGINVSFFFRGDHTVIDAKIYDTLKKITTELVTNTLKHANASKLLLSITMDGEKIVLQTMDNGKGDKPIVKGNGLNGIDTRLALVSGKAKYAVDQNEGFSANVCIPLT